MNPIRNNRNSLAKGIVMTGKREYSVERGIANYDYPTDGYLRRRLHEWGASGFDFYGEALRQMGYGPGDIALDVGAGLGYDGLRIATTYHPRAVYLLEPSGEMVPGNSLITDFDEKYLLIGETLRKDGHSEIQLMPAADATRLTAELLSHDSAFLTPGTTYLQPMPAVAENIPLPDGSVTKLSVIHSAYHFSDIPKALSEARRVLAPGGLGVLITNGPRDKLVFKKYIRQAGAAMNNDAPNTVSSRLNYKAAIPMISEYFEIVGEPLIYEDDMLIDEDRLPDYIWAFNSYRHLFARPVDSDGRWNIIRKHILEDPIKKEMARNGGIATDTIDIAAIYFRSK